MSTVAQTNSPSPFRLETVIGPGIEQYRDQAEPILCLLKRADPRLDVGHIFEAIAQEKMVAWLLWDNLELTGVCITREKYLYEKRVLEIVSASGSGFEPWIGILTAGFVDYAKYLGCDGLRTKCRPGMARWLKNHGWKTAHVVMDLMEGQTNG